MTTLFRNAASRHQNCASRRDPSRLGLDRLTASRQVMPSLARAGFFACFLLACSVADAAGRNNGSGSADSNERPQRIQEMRRQLLEHQRLWRGDPVVERSPSSPGATDASAGAGSIVKTSPLGATALVPLKTPALDVTSTAARVSPDPDAPPLGEIRLDDGERSLLRQQLRRIPNIRPVPE